MWETTWFTTLFNPWPLPPPSPTPVEYKWPLAILIRIHVYVYRYKISFSQMQVTNVSPNTNPETCTGTYILYCTHGHITWYICIVMTIPRHARWVTYIFHYLLLILSLSFLSAVSCYTLLHHQIRYAVCASRLSVLRALSEVWWGRIVQAARRYIAHTYTKWMELYKPCKLQSQIAKHACYTELIPKCQQTSETSLITNLRKLRNKQQLEKKDAIYISQLVPL